MKILFLSQRVPYPPNRGDKITTWRLIERMHREHDVRCIAFAHDANDEVAARELEKKGFAIETFPYRDRWKKLSSLPLLATSVAHVSAGSAPLRVELQRGLTIEGVLRDGHGAALGDYSVSAVGPEGEVGWTSYTDAEGRFAMPVARVTTWTLEVYGPGQLEGAPLRSLPGVAAGTLDVWIELR